MRIDELWIKRKIICVLAISTTLFSATSFGATFCVSNETELQDALTTAASNEEDDTIQIVQGTYNGNFTYASYESNSLTLEGGYTSDCATRTIDPENTVLDGGGVDHVLALVTSDAEADFSVEGLTLRNGSASTAANGGGLYTRTEGAVTLTNNTFIGNTAPSGWTGGAAVGDYSMLTNNTFFGNNAESCGGGAVVGRYSTLTNNTFTENIAGSGGGGAHVGEYSTLTNNTFSGNTVRWEFQNGGGAYVGSSSTLSSNIFIGNAAGSGGGAYVSSESTLTDNIFSENTAGSGGGAAGFGTLKNNIFTRNTATDGNGGGAAVRGTLTNNIFTWNTATNGNGGGASVERWSTLTNNIFIGNAAGSDGGGAYVSGDSTLTNNSFSENTARVGGGGVSVSFRSKLTNNSFGKNTAKDGGGMYSNGSDYTILTNNTFHDNTASSQGGGIWVRYYTKGSSGSVYNNIIWNNTASGASDLYIDNTGNDPFFPVTVNLFNNDFDHSRFAHFFCTC